jgi:hypothetical protein
MCPTNTGLDKEPVTLSVQRARRRQVKRGKVRPRLRCKDEKVRKVRRSREGEKKK